MKRTIETASWATTLGVGALTALGATLAFLPQARGELVYENQAEEATEPTQSAARLDDRSAMRQAIGSSERARTTVQAQQPPVQQAQQPVVQVLPAQAAAPAPQTVIQQPIVQQQPVQQIVRTQYVQVAAAPAPAPVYEAAPAPVVAPAIEPAPASVETQNMSRAEMLRRSRMREELRNEDTLQSRLEELRLRDEQRRTDQIIGRGAAAASGPEAVAPSGAAVQEVIAAPVTERPGQPAQLVAAPPAQTTVASVQGVTAMDQGGMMGVSTATNSEYSSDKTQFSIAPRAGLSNLRTDGLNYDVKPRFSVGVGANVATSDNLSFELGYMYSEYGINAASSNPYVNYSQMYQPGYNYGNSQTLVLKQNVIDAGLKISLLGPESKVRPFIGGGGAYAKSFVNYDQQILNGINQTPYLAQLGSDYELQQFLGYVEGGLDVKMGKSMSVGILFKYYAVLSSTENNSLNNYAFGGYGGYPYGGQIPDADKQYVGGSLAKVGFYSVLGGFNFVF